ncbi:replication endonuclease [Burkholderia vietnamiensis]|uniref:replication endonuclease n=1 Tax=Burkholderia vietnamiensis TaxID=60552 RepID=UPI000B33FFC5|nr:replication endonuclease [Burkholderia vietnamiensis]
MTYNKNTINNNNSNVNAWDIEDLIKEEEKEELLKSAIKKERFEKVRRKKMAFERQCPQLFSLVPECQKTAVAWQIKHFFKNDPELYCSTIQKFFTFFDKKKKAICDEAIALGDEERKKKNKLRKDYLLYSSQLLGLVGGAYGSRYINDALLNIYVDDQKAQQDFYDAFRLVNAQGKVRRLVPLEKKKEVQRARILNISSAMAQIAIDKGFTFSLITFTLPPVFHNNAIKGSSASYQGFLPSDGQKFLERMGQEFRALLAKRGMKAGENYFGCSVFEAMKSSVGHKHYLIYTAKDDVHYLREIIEGMEVRVRNEYQCLYNIDMKENDGKNGSNGASYIFKYITKTLGELESADDTQKRNMAVRWYHSARAFNFFGIKQAVTKFNFLCDCVEQYKGYYSDDIYNALSSYNYYEFITKFEQYFKIVRDENNKVKFVKFDLAGNFRAPQLKEMMKAQVIIEKKVFSVFECPATLSDVLSLEGLNPDEHIGAFHAWEEVKQKQAEYDKDIKQQALACGIPSYVAGADVSLNNVMDKHYPRWKEEIKYFFYGGVTVKEKLSSKNLADQSAIPIVEEKTVYSARLSDEINEKIRKLIDERRKEKGLI